MIFPGWSGLNAGAGVGEFNERETVRGNARTKVHVRVQRAKRSDFNPETECIKRKKAGHLLYTKSDYYSQSICHFICHL